MSSPALRRTVFGEKLRRELDRQDVSVRALARKLQPQQPEVARRNLARWIGGYNRPTTAHRDAIADALGVSREQFAADDEEEDDPLVALMNAVRRVVREEVERELRRT